MKEEMKTTLVKWCLIGGGVLLLLLLVQVAFGKKENDTSLYKKDTTKDYVYSDRVVPLKDSGISSELPVINLTGSDIEKVNLELENQFEKVIEDDYTQFTYQYDVSSNFLSLVIFLNKVEKNNPFPRVQIKTYNFRLKDGLLLTDEALYKTFKTKRARLAQHFEKIMHTYYKEEIKEGYMYEEECDFACFLSVRGIENTEDDIHLYIKGNNLMYYRPFVIYNVMMEEYFYEDIEEDFLFSLNEKG